MLQHGVSLGLRNLHKKGEGLQPLGYASPPSFRTERSFMIRSEYALCRHTKTDGRRCQSPALATSAFCHLTSSFCATRRISVVAFVELPLAGPQSSSHPPLHRRRGAGPQHPRPSPSAQRPLHPAGSLHGLQRYLDRPNQPQTSRQNALCPPTRRQNPNRMTNLGVTPINKVFCSNPHPPTH